MRRAPWAWVLVAPAAAWALLRLFGVERGFALVALAAFTPYAAVLAAAATLVALALRRRLAALVGALSLAVPVAVVVPRMRPDAPDPASGPVIRVLSANVLHGSVAPADLLALARAQRADVLAVQELTPELDAVLRSAYPHRIAEPRPAVEGTGLYARLPLDRAPSPAGTAFAQVAATIRLPGGTGARLLSVHPRAPVGPAAIDGWRSDLRALPRAPRAGPPAILAGDFNATLDHRELRRILATGYEDAGDEAGGGLRPTWPRGRTALPPSVTIDHILASARVRVRAYDVLELPRSDHRAVLAELQLPS